MPRRAGGRLVSWWRNVWAAVRGKGPVKGDGYDFSEWYRDGKNIFATRTGYQLASNETIFSAVSRLSNAMSSMPIKLRRNYEHVISERSELLEYRSNPNMTAFDFIRCLETHRGTDGNGYAIKDYDSRARVKALWVLDPTRVDPVIERESRELWYKVQPDNGETYYVHNADMIHVRHIYAGTTYKGISPIRVLAGTIDFDAKVREFSLESMDAQTKASFILKLAASVDLQTKQGQEKLETMLAPFRQFYREAGGVLIQQAGAEIEPLDRKFLDTKVFEVERITRSRVATVYNMPLHMLGESEGTSYSSQEQAWLEFLSFTLLPIVRHYEAEFNTKLLTPAERRAGLEFKFGLNAIARADMRTRGEFYHRGTRSGWFTLNEVRAWEELPPHPHGDQLLVSKDLIPLSKMFVEAEGGEAGEGGQTA